MKRKYFGTILLLVALLVSTLGPSDLFADKAIRVVHQTETKKVDQTEVLKEPMGKLFGNYIAVETGVVRSGEQIPLPRYGDGKEAKREECRYFVSTNEVATSVVDFVPTPGVFFIQCKVDKSGVVHVSLKQEGSATGETRDVSDDPGYKSLQEHYERHNISSLGGSEGSTITRESATGYQGKVMQGIKDRVLANYMVIAVRTPEEGAAKK